MNDVQAGDREAIRASEEVQVRNLTSIAEFSQDTRKMVREVDNVVTALQNKMIAMSAQLDQQRKQLAALQQQFYSKGTVSYTGDDS